MVNPAQNRAVKVTVASLGMVIAAFFGAASASADTILLPGHSDGDCWGYVAQLANTNQVVPPGTTPDNLPPGVSCANYSAQMAPISGDAINTEDSTSEGAQKAHDICAYIQGRRRNAQCTFRTFSEGTIAGAKVQNQELAEGNKHTNLVTDGNAVGSTGILNSALVQNPIVGPIALSNPSPNVPFSINPDGIPWVPEPPNTDNSYSKYDFFANGRQDNPFAYIQQATSGEHAVMDPDAPHVDFKGPNGETNHVYDVDNNSLVQDNIPSPSAPPASLPTPSFFGEAPCIAPDGSQYYTPADAPC